jgi:dTDP-4-amino-4,6-dideoxygalactose transaminase
VKLAMHSLGIGPGDEVICPADAFLTTLVLTATSGAVPVLVDIDPHTLQLDPRAVNAAVTPRTRLILGVDRYGTTPDFRALGALCRRHGLQLLEDGSQARGALFDGRPVGSLGAASLCSLGAPSTGSVLNSGGVFATDDDDVAAAARRLLLVDDGQMTVGLGLGPTPLPPTLSLGPDGSTYLMSEFDAAVANAQLSVLDDDTAARCINGAHLARQLALIPGLDIPATVPGASHVYTSLPVLVRPDELGLPESATVALRNTVVDCMMAEGLWLDRWAPQPVGADTSIGMVDYRIGVDGAELICRRSEFPTTSAVADATFVVGNGRSPLGAPLSTVAMDRIADCFVKVLVDNLDRVRALTLERTANDPFT